LIRNARAECDATRSIKPQHAHLNTFHSAGGRASKVLFAPTFHPAPSVAHHPFYLAQLGTIMDLDPQFHDPGFRHLPHDKRWPHLKDIIVKLYMEQRLTLKSLAETMKTDYGFDAQYVRFCICKVVPSFPVPTKKFSTQQAASLSIPFQAMGH
jgi:hypothetical protein